MSSGETAGEATRGPAEAPAATDRGAGAQAPAPPSVAPPVRRRGLELPVALAAIALVTALWVLAARGDGGVPASSSLVGHGIGIAGSVLMLMTATLYSLRKLSTSARWGSTASWLRFHMVTGPVGPYMVLLHTAGRFQGLAGFATLLTVVVVASGLTGRYLYTRVPREPKAATARRRLAVWHLVHLPLTWALFAAAIVHIVAALYYGTLQR